MLAARQRAHNAKVVIVAVTAGVLAVVGLAARVSHPGSGGTAADPTQNLTQFTLDDDDLESGSGGESSGQGGAFLAPPTGPAVSSTATS